MKNIISLLLTAFFTAVIVSFTLVSSASAGTALTASEVIELLSGKTFTVTDAQMNKATGKKDSFTIQAFQGGVIQEVGNPDSGQGEPRVWSVNDNGSFCYSGRYTRRNRSVRHCGYIVPAGSGTYNMYQYNVSPTKKKNMQKVKFPNNRTKHIFTFSNFK